MCPYDVAVVGRIERNSVAYFDHCTAFKALWCRTSIKGKAHTHCIDVAIPDMFTQCVCVPPLMEALHYGTSNTTLTTGINLSLVQLLHPFLVQLFPNCTRIHVITNHFIIILLIGEAVIKSTRLHFG